MSEMVGDSVVGSSLRCPEAGDLFSYYGLEDDFHYEDLLQLLQNLHQRDERPQIDKIRASHQHLWRVSSRAVAPPAARIEAVPSALFASIRAAGGATARAVLNEQCQVQAITLSIRGRLSRWSNFWSD